jgi:hypothetical protein
MRRVPAKQKLKTLLQPRILLEKFHLFTVQLRHFADSKQSPSNRLEFIAALRTPLWFASGWGYRGRRLSRGLT